MSWRTVVISKRAKLEHKLEYLVVRGDETQRVHLSEISTLIVENTAVSLTASLLCELIKKKVKVIFCDEKRNPCSELSAYYGSHDTSGKVREQIDWSLESKRMIWTEIVREKILNQSELLGKLGKQEAQLLEGYLSELMENDVSNREGHAAKVYFNALFGMDFSRHIDMATNSALNYGYSILLSAFNREISSSGYITQIGISHSNQFNPFNFSSDLMEPFRPLVDRMVYEMGPNKFEHSEKLVLASLLNDEVYIEGKRHYIGNAIKIYCSSVFDALNSSDVTSLRFYRNEL